MFQLQTKRHYWNIPLSGGSASPSQYTADLRKELLRKSIHITIALIPSIASWSLSAAVSLLAGCTLLYTCVEILRQQGYKFSLISNVIDTVSRDRDRGHFVYGPVTLALGAMIALMLYPHPAASLAIYALAFGDSASSIAGKGLKSIHLPLMGGKTLAGSLACFTTVFAVCDMSAVSAGKALLIALTATVLEALPSRDLDNILIPVGTGLVATLLLSV